MDDRVAMAISHWAPRFTTNGVTAGDFERITGGLAAWDDWCAAWSGVAAEHEQLGQATGARRHVVRRLLEQVEEPVIRGQQSEPHRAVHLIGAVGQSGRMGAAPAGAGDLQPAHERDKGHRVVTLPGAGHRRQRPAAVIGKQVDLAGQPAPGPA